MAEGVNPADSSSDADDVPAEAVCEICGSDQGTLLLVLCNNHGPDHNVGCHSYCMAGDRWRKAHEVTDYYCAACSEYRSRMTNAYDNWMEQKRAAAWMRKGKTADAQELPELPQLPAAPPRVRHVSNTRVQATVQQKIDAASKASAAKAARTADRLQTLGPAALAAAAAVGPRRHPSVRLPDLPKRSHGLPLAGCGAAAAKAAAAAATSDGPSDSGAGRKRHQQQQGAGVALKRAHAGTHKQPRQHAASMAATGVSIMKLGATKKQILDGQQGAQAQATAGLRWHQHQGFGVTVDMDMYSIEVVTAHINCRVVAAGVDAGQEEVADIELSGLLKRSWQVQNDATAKQQTHFDFNILPMLTQLDPGATKKELAAGVFSWNLHPTVQRYIQSPELVYQPMVFSPVARDREPVKENLYKRQWFVAVSLGDKLLVFLPTRQGELVLHLTKDAVEADNMVSDVVKSVMKDDKLAQTAAEPPPVSESFNQVPAANNPAEDSKDLVQEQPDKLQAAQPLEVSDRHQHNVLQQHGRHEQKGVHLAEQVDSDLLQQPQEHKQQQQQQQQLVSKQQQHSGPPVQPLPPSMTQRQKQQQQLSPGQLSNPLQPSPQQQQQRAHGRQSEPAQLASQQQQEQQQGHHHHQQQQQQETSARHVSVLKEAPAQSNGSGLKQQQHQRFSAGTTDIAVADGRVATIAAAPLGVELTTSSKDDTQQTAKEPAGAAVAATSLAAANDAGYMAVAAVPPASPENTGARDQADGAGTPYAARIDTVGISSSKCASNGSAAALEAVQNSSVAQLLRNHVAGAADGAGGNVGSKRLLWQWIMPQIEDLASVQELRLYLLGFSTEQLAESSALSATITAASSLNATVHCPPDALQLLCKALQVPGPVAAAAPGVLCHSPGLSGETTAAGGETAGYAPAAAPQGQVDPTQAHDSRQHICCRHVLVVPEHTTAAGLQQMLGSLPLWRLLAAPVAVFWQGPGQGLLQWLCRFCCRQQGQRQQQEQSKWSNQPEQEQQKAAASVVTLSGLLHSSIKNIAEDSVPHSMFTISRLSHYQLFKNGIAVVVSCSALQCSSKQQVWSLLQLLSQAHEQQQQQRVVMEAEWSVMLSQQHLVSLSKGRQQLLQGGLQTGRVLLLDAKLTPGTLQGEERSPGQVQPLVANAIKLAQQRAHELRLILIAVPDIGSQEVPMDPAIQQSARQTLLCGTGEGSVLTGTMSQVLQLLQQVVGQ